MDQYREDGSQEGRLTVVRLRAVDDVSLVDLLEPWVGHERSGVASLLRVCGDHLVRKSQPLAARRPDLW